MAQDSGYGHGISMFSPSKRRALQEGGALPIPPEQGGLPVDTFTPPEQLHAAQVPDEQMENEFVDHVLSQALEPEEMDYLESVLAADEQLSQIFDKVVETASEFSGAGPVEGPGTGVSDSIPARLSDGEFVFTKAATDELGADKLQIMMDEAERSAQGGVMRKYALGGRTETSELAERARRGAEVDLTTEEITRLMIDANRMPSVSTPRRVGDY